MSRAMQIYDSHFAKSYFKVYNWRPETKYIPTGAEHPQASAAARLNGMFYRIVLQKHRSQLARVSAPQFIGQGIRDV